MKKLRLLIVEDVEQELESFRDDLEDYTREKERDIDLVECKTLEDALGSVYLLAADPVMERLPRFYKSFFNLQTIT